MPPYHIAGMANLLTNLYSGRRIVYLDAFDAAGLARSRSSREGITHAMVVPTMLGPHRRRRRRRAAAASDAAHARPTAVRRMPVTVLERALALFPDVGFVNAYGLTETSLDDRRARPRRPPRRGRSRRPGRAPAASARSGRPVPGIEVELRDELGELVPRRARRASIWLRGEQVSGEYATGSVLDDDGWFPTRDRGCIDDEGYLFIEGRADDTIIRGGENIAPAEIEDALLSRTRRSTTPAWSASPTTSGASGSPPSSC